MDKAKRAARDKKYQQANAQRFRDANARQRKRLKLMEQMLRKYHSKEEIDDYLSYNWDKEEK